MLVIFGLLRRVTILGLKFDECSNCGSLCEHVVARKTNWGHVFWVPVLFLGWQHGMLCTSCQTWSGIAWRDVRAAMRSGRLHLDRPRPHTPALLAAAAQESGEAAPDANQVLDRLVVNPKRGFWDLYLKVWAVAVAVLLVASVASGVSRQGTGVGGYSQGAGGTQVVAPAYGQAHRCWEDSTGQITGCQMNDGSLMGVTSGIATTCYFSEPLPPSQTTVRCDR